MSTSRASPARCGRAAVTMARLEASLAVEMRNAPFRITSRSAPLRRSTSSPLRPSSRSSTSTTGLTPTRLLAPAPCPRRRRVLASSLAAAEVVGDERVDVPPDVFGQRRHVTVGLEQPAMVEPVEPLQRGVLDVVDALPGAAPTNQLRLVEADDGLGEGVIVAVAARADRDVHAGLGEALRVADREVCQPQMKREKASPMKAT